MTPPEDRRLEPRRATNVRGIVLTPGFEIGCAIVDASAGGMKLRLDRNLSLPRTIILIDIAAGLACEADTAWSKGLEAGLKCRSQASLRGLVPARLAPARDAWLRAGGR